jgi:hypothetical protein
MNNATAMFRKSVANRFMNSVKVLFAPAGTNRLWCASQSGLFQAVGVRKLSAFPVRLSCKKFAAQAVSNLIPALADVFMFQERFPVAQSNSHQKRFAARFGSLVKRLGKLKPVTWCLVKSAGLSTIRFAKWFLKPFAIVPLTQFAAWFPNSV